MSNKEVPDNIHIVKHGEYSNHIAEKYGLTMDQLRAANPGVDLMFIYAGMRINISTDSACIPEAPTYAYTIESSVNAMLKNL